MKASERYYSRVCEILDEVFRVEADAIEEAAQAVARANRSGNSVFAFGCNHAGLITLELFYRTGGLVTINPVRAPGMMLELSPPTMTSEMERMPGYGKIIFGNLKTKPGDVLIIHSVSGRNAVTVDMAEAAREAGMTVIVVTNLNTAKFVTSRHPSGKKLHDFASTTATAGTRPSRSRDSRRRSRPRPPSSARRSSTPSRRGSASFSWKRARRLRSS